MPRLASYNDCTGCMACYNACPKQAVEISDSHDGFLYPAVNADKCVDCGACERACPVVSSLGSLGKGHPQAFAVWHKKDRCVSSSGGAFSAFARNVIEKNGGVFGAAFDGTLHLKHTEVWDVEELTALRGSKYVQSEIGGSFRKIKKYLQEGRKVFFCGTPCQVAGLQGYLGKSYDNLLTADLACHGVPSDGIFQKYLKKLKNRLGNAEILIKNYEFRRRDGWGLAPSISTTSNCRALYGVDALYMEAFDKSAIFRESCYHCPFARLPRVGDVTLADFWGIGRHGKKFKHNVMKGVSLVLVNTERGCHALSTLGDDTFIEERTLEEALVENHNLIAPSKRHHLRDEIIEAFMDERMSLKDIDERFCLVNHGLKGKVKMWSLELGLFDKVKALYNLYKTI